MLAKSYDASSNVQPDTRRVLLVLLLGGVVVSLNNSALNPAVPIFMQLFNTDFVTGGWVLNGYMLAMSIGLMLAAYVKRIVGLKLAYVSSFLVFAIGSLLGALANSIDVVITARLIQGFCGGLIIPLSIGALYQTYPKDMHGRMMALWGIVIMMSLSFGPVFGAVITEYLSWHMLFIVPALLSVVVVLISSQMMQNPAPQDTKTTFDGVGFCMLALLVIGLSVWLSSLSSGNHDQASWDILIATAFIIVGVIWWRFERAHSNPVINVSLFSNSAYRHANVISVSQTIGLMACLLLLPIVIQTIMQLSPLWTGVTLLLATFAASITTHFAGKIVDQRGARTIGVVGIALSVIATLLLVWCLYQPTLCALIVVMILRAVGVGLSYIPTTSVGFSSLTKDQVTEGAAINNLCRRMATVLSISLITLYVDVRSISYRGAQDGLTVAIQDVFITLSLFLLLTIWSALKLPKTAAKESETC